MAKAFALSDWGNMNWRKILWDASKSSWSARLPKDLAASKGYGIPSVHAEALLFSMLISNLDDEPKCTLSKFPNTIKLGKVADIWQNFDHQWFSRKAWWNSARNENFCTRGEIASHICSDCEARDWIEAVMGRKLRERNSVTAKLSISQNFFLLWTNQAT